MAFLVNRGYAIVERNFRTRLGELDVIATDGDTLVFVEVRSRRSLDRGSPLETVDAAKQRRIAQVAAMYLATRAPRARAVRFDVVGVVGEQITLVVDAFRAG